MSLAHANPPFPAEGPLRATLAADVHVRSFEGEAILLDAHSGDYFALNDVGADFVAALVEGLSLEESARRLAEAYDVDWAVLCTDLLHLYRELLSRKLIVARAPSSATLEAPSS